MADRTLGQTALLYADLPGGDLDQILVTVLDPYGVIVSEEDVTVPAGQDRYFYTTPILTLAGVYDVQWSYVTRGVTVQQTFTVGRQPLSGLTKYDLRAQIASRVSEVEFGEVSSADSSTIADTSLIGGADEYVNWWVMLGPDTVDAGLIRRVVDYNGSALVLNDPFISTPLRGQQYILFKVSPREVDRALRVAVNELSQQTRIETRIENISVVDDLLVVPRGITHVSAVFANHIKQLPADWHMESGRRIAFDTSPDAPVDLIGIRESGFPQYEDSLVETDVTATIARGANLLHANRAGGSAIDTEEHLRRQLASADDFERARRTAVGRIPPGTRIVLE
jgi:hypothetical protein